MVDVKNIGLSVANIFGLGKSSNGRRKRRPRYGIYANGRRIGSSFTKASAKKRVRGKRGVSFRKLR
ncbi:hypothetical protein [Flagellimonas onchidii]|uniref:hypothetical protein n=1 Tax=Flagellimonas onchidii TaxID=2562684 RepID=UPI0010A69DFA|nr:hypothetical protein [Allomuricauda onchidii]